jgi:predicted amidophosphoribosyltransferase
MRSWCSTADEHFQWAFGTDQAIFGLQSSERLHVPGPPGICSYCGSQLRALDAEQCYTCGADWHDQTRVVSRRRRGGWQRPQSAASRPSR